MPWCIRGTYLDLYIADDEAILAEIKSSAKWYEIEDFAEKAEVAVRYLKLEGKKITKVLISLDRHPSVVKACKKHNIVFLWEEKLERELEEEEAETIDEF